jgi:hypothetical protein
VLEQLLHSPVLLEGYSSGRADGDDGGRGGCLWAAQEEGPDPLEVALAAAERGGARVLQQRLWQEQREQQRQGDVGEAWDEEEEEFGEGEDEDEGGWEDLGELQGHVGGSELEHGEAASSGAFAACGAPPWLLPCAAPAPPVLARDAVQAAWACGKLRHWNGAFLAAVRERLPAMLAGGGGGLSDVEAVSLLWALARLNYTNRDALAALCDEVGWRSVGSAL